MRESRSEALPGVDKDAENATAAAAAADVDADTTETDFWRPNSFSAAPD